jgi:cytochrome c oxidase subunit 2
MSCRRPARRGAGLPLLLLAACNPTSSALDPAGSQAARIGDIWWLMFWVCTVIYAGVVLWLALALLSRHRPAADLPVLHPDPVNERRFSGMLTGWVALSVVVLFGLTFSSYWTDRRLASPFGAETLVIEVTASQWWWQVRYPDADASRTLTTANEIHIPAGTKVRLVLRSQDVIHSFWVPNLNGKQDLIPGRETDIIIEASREGVFRGQCAEFCGVQHAQMALQVIARSPAAFEAWRNDQLQPADEPTDDARRRGRDVFLASACVMCHTIRGTPASGRTGPDLTHLASRREIAAGALPMNRGNLAAWIADPQGIKPGNHMPIVGMTADDLQSLLAYLEGLQ